MRHRDPRATLFSRRASILITAKVGMLGALLARAYYLQIKDAEKYKLKADENRINLQLLVPARGQIVDRFGRLLAHNEKNFRVEMVAEEAGDVDHALDRIKTFIPLTKRQIDRIRSSIKSKRNFLPVVIADNLDWQQFSTINVALTRLPGIYPRAGDLRVYARGKDLAHVVGYVGKVTSRELTGKRLLEHPEFRIGKDGVEKVREGQLQGRAGNRQVEVNAVGRIIRELDRKDPDDGSSVMLTVDADLQKKVMETLIGESAASVVMDIHKGEILALASNPTFDPNQFSLGVSADAWRHLSRDPRAPLSNKAVVGQYPPGSTYRMVVALAALTAGIVKPDEKIFCNGLYKLGNGWFHCWRGKYGGHGHMILQQALAQSCDVYFYELAKRLGPDKIAETAWKLGLGQKADIGLPNERAGLIPTPDWKQAVLGRRWQGGETLIAGIGQGYVLATPLQLALMTSRLCNGGRGVTAKLIDTSNSVGGDGNADKALSDPMPQDLGFAQEHLDAVLAGMVAAVNDKKGTARSLKFNKAHGTMAGKTGTVQVKRITRAERAAGITKNKDRLWKDRDHSMFVAYAPVLKPRYAVSVVIEHGGSGIEAGRIATKIMDETMRLDPAGRQKHSRAVSQKSIEALR